jgi:hypothetical protein
MSRKKKPLPDRVTRAAQAALDAQGYVSSLDVLLGIGWLNPSTAESWRRGQFTCLEDAVQADPSRVPEAMRLLRSWAKERNLLPSPVQYFSRSVQHQPLRFSRSGDTAIEEAYRTHWVSQEFSEKKRERLAEKASRAPELVAVLPLKSDWTCHRCGGTGDLLIMENPGPACLRCIGLDDLEFLPAGDALLSRRAKAKSTRCAVVVRFSRTRRRYERQGLLIEPSALAQVRNDLDAQRRDVRNESSNPLPQTRDRPRA